MDEMDVDDDELSADPLAKLLQDVNGLVRRSDTGVGKKRKLRPETLDIQRTKDIEGVQAVKMSYASSRRPAQLTFDSLPSRPCHFIPNTHYCSPLDLLLPSIFITSPHLLLRRVPTHS